jgi:hypothetical protein
MEESSCIWLSSKVATQAPSPLTYAAVFNPTLWNRYKLNVTVSWPVEVHFCQLLQWLNIHLMHTIPYTLSWIPPLQVMSDQWHPNRQTCNSPLSSHTATVLSNYFPPIKTTWWCILMGHLFRIQQAMPSYTTARYFLITFVHLTASTLCYVPSSSVHPASKLEMSTFLQISLSALQSLDAYVPDVIITNILRKVSHLQKTKRFTIHYWIPGHTGLHSNEASCFA